MDTEYKVIWVIDVTASTPLEAAKRAREAQTREDTTAVVFDVFDRKRNAARRVDLSKQEGFEVTSAVLPPFNFEYLKVALDDARTTLKAIPYINGDMDDMIIETIENINQALERG